MKQETLEEVAEDFWLNDDSMTENDRISYVNGFLACSKWHQERSYSEEEVMEIASLSRDRGERHGNILWDEWFEQFKKEIR